MVNAVGSAGMAAAHRQQQCMRKLALAAVPGMVIGCGIMAV